MEATEPSSDSRAAKMAEALVRNTDSFIYKILTSGEMSGIYGMHLIEINDNIQNDSTRDLPGNGEYQITELVIKNGTQNSPSITILLFFGFTQKVWGLMNIQSTLSDEKVSSLIETMSAIYPKFDYSGEYISTITTRPDIHNGETNSAVYITAYNLRNLCKKIISYSLL